MEFTLPRRRVSLNLGQRYHTDVHAFCRKAELYYRPP